MPQVNVAVYYTQRTCLHSFSNKLINDLSRCFLKDYTKHRTYIIVLRAEQIWFFWWMDPILLFNTPQLLLLFLYCRYNTQVTNGHNIHFQNCGTPECHSSNQSAKPCTSPVTLKDRHTQINEVLVFTICHNIFGDVFNWILERYTIFESQSKYYMYEG